jgi:two-component system, NtrC family, response regulator GlrR
MRAEETQEEHMASTLSSGTRSNTLNKGMMPIGEWLVRRSIVSKGQVERALLESKERQMRVGDALVHLGLLDRKSIEREIQLRKRFHQASANPLAVTAPAAPAAPEASEGWGTLLGKSSAMRDLFALLSKAAPSELTMLIEGQTGTGKEVVAAEIHRHSPRHNGPYCVVDCGSLPPNLIESELFGHDHGAFTGAVTERQGVFERAKGGVVFLDEVGELPLDLQTRLLRVIDQRVIKRVGGTEERSVDVRIIAATKRDLQRMVARGRFREDLYYRLAVVKITMPNLKNRREDIALLAAHFLKQAGWTATEEVLQPEVLEALSQAAWQGNVRELRNLLERTRVLAGDDPTALGRLIIEQLREQRQGSADHDEVSEMLQALPPELFGQAFKVLKKQLVAKLEATYLERLCRQYGVNVTRIAQVARLDRHLVRNLLRKHGMKKDEMVP